MTSEGGSTARDRSESGSGGLRWKLRRLRSMDAAEVLHRVVQAARARCEAAGIARIPAKAPEAGLAALAWLPHAPDHVDAADVIRRARSILAGRFDVFAMHDATLGFPPEWNRDPRTGTLAPMDFGKRLNYRDPALVGDIKYLWEPSRHLELVTLAQAFVVTGDSCYAEGARLLLESWFDQCPYPQGVHWASSLEHAVRLINWSVAWQMLDSGDWLGAPQQAALRKRWLGEIFRHQAFVAGHLSRHSSANNHLFGEYTGIFVAAMTWPLWRESAAWRERARSGLEREALLQNAPDGVNREQGLWYHHEVADMMLLAGLAARAAREDFPGRFWQRLLDMLVYIASLMSVSGSLPMIGDSDDAVMVRFSGAADFDVYRSLLATGAVLFGRSDLAIKADRFDDKSRWLLGRSAEAEFDRLRQQGLTNASDARPSRRAFEEGGYWVIGDRLGQADEVRLIADAGPLGYLSIAAHGHADALAFTLSSAGRELLIDPGTYAYHTLPQWRDYFKGTSAHNTLRIDGRDQSVSGGSFLWLRHANATLLEAKFGDDRDEWVATHDGYTRLADPVRHTRRIVFDKGAREIRVDDTLDCRGAHEVELFWHFAEDCEVRLVDGGLNVQNGPVAMSMQLPSGSGIVELVQGREHPPLGWISRRFDQKVAAFSATWRGKVNGSTTLTTLLRLAPIRADVLGLSNA